MNGRLRVAALCAVGAVLSTAVWAQTPAPSATPATAAPDAVARSAQALGVLRALAGNWDVAVTVFARGQAPVKLSGTSENTWVLGGRFLQCTFTAAGGATPVDGLTTYGYDRDRQEYFAVNVNTSAYPYGVMHGPYYEGNRSFVLRSDTASSGGVRVKRRQVIRLEGDDKQVFEVFIEYGTAPPAKVLEAVLTRR
jgi:hypothetical protein